MKRFKLDDKSISISLIILGVVVFSCFTIAFISEMEFEKPYIIRYEFQETEYDYEIYKESMFIYDIVFEAESDGRLYIYRNTSMCGEYEYDSGQNIIQFVMFEPTEYTFEFRDRVYYKWYY